MNHATRSFAPSPARPGSRTRSKDGLGDGPAGRGLVLRPRALVRARAERAGAALMMALLVLFVLVLIVGQISIGTSTDFRTARNEVELSAFDLAIESALLKAMEDLKQDAIEDAEASQAGGGAGGAGLGGAAGALGAGGGTGLDALSNLPGMGGLPGGGGGQNSGPSDSRKDLWAQPQRTSEFSPIELRVLIQDESSKFNVLQMLTENEEEADKAFQRVVAIIDLFRDGTAEDVERNRAEDMAEAMRRYMTDRGGFDTPRPDLVTTFEYEEERYLPLSLREFLVLEEFEPKHFRDYRDEEDNVVHSLTSFLTVHSAMWTRSEMLEARDAAAGEDGEAGEQREERDEEDGGFGSGLSAVGGSSGRVFTTGSEGVEGADRKDGGGGGNASSNQSAGTIVEGAVNLNTAPGAVLKGLFDDRDVPPQFWDEVIQYRNEERELAPGEDEPEPMLDEFGEPIPDNQIFTSPNDLNQLDWWKDLEPRARDDIKQHVDVVSQVFTIYVTAWRSTSAQQGTASSRNEQERAEQSLSNLRRTVACTVWRRGSGEDTEIVPIVRWEVLDYMPYEVLDYPDEGR